MNKTSRRLVAAALVVTPHRAGFLSSGARGERLRCDAIRASRRRT